MRRRIAFRVTCVCLVCCIAFMALYTFATLNQLTRSATDDLLRICRMSAIYLDNAAFSPSDEKSAIKEMAGELGAEITILDSNGAALVESRITASANAETDEELIAAYDPEIGEGTAIRTVRGTRTIYAARRMEENGYVIRVWREAPGVTTVIGDMGVRLALIAAILVVICVLMVQTTMAPAEQLIAGIRGVLFGFAEGRFDERVTFKGNSRYAHWANEVNEAARRIEERLLHQNRRTQAMSAVMNQSQSGMIAVDDQMNIILITSLAKQLLGIKGNCDGIPLAGASKDVNLEPVFQEAMRHDGVYTNEVAVRSGTTGRGHTPLRLYVSSLKQDGRTMGAVAMVEDITELRRMEQVRTDFAANVSHELKTPLTSIKGFVETLMEGAIDNPPMAKKFLRIIMMEADRLTRLINDILSITKMESGQEEVSNERIQLDQMAADIADMLSIHAGEKGVAVACNQPEEPMFVWGNPDRVEQLLINLVENAIKYNRQGGSVHVSVYGAGENVQLLVSDTGIGIAEEHLPRLFERFYRVDKGRSRSMGGTGLGLAIVKHITSSMGGMIEVHSKLGEGTEFLVTLPRYCGAEESAKNQEEDIECR